MGCPGAPAVEGSRMSRDSCSSSPFSSSPTAAPNLTCPAPRPLLVPLFLPLAPAVSVLEEQVPAFRTHLLEHMAARKPVQSFMVQTWVPSSDISEAVPSIHKDYLGKTLQELVRREGGAGGQGGRVNEGEGKGRGMAETKGC